MSSTNSSSTSEVTQQQRLNRDLSNWQNIKQNENAPNLFSALPTPTISIKDLQARNLNENLIDSNQISQILFQSSPMLSFPANTQQPDVDRYSSSNRGSSAEIASPQEAQIQNSRQRQIQPQFQPPLQLDLHSVSRTPILPLPYPIGMDQTQISLRSAPPLQPNKSSSIPSSMMSHFRTQQEEKKQKRLIKNRQAAKECRRKKKLYVTDLEKKIRELTAENEKLKEELKRCKELIDPSKLKDIEKFENQGSSQQTDQNQNEEDQKDLKFLDFLRSSDDS